MLSGGDKRESRGKLLAWVRRIVATDIGLGGGGVTNRDRGKGGGGGG